MKHRICNLQINGNNLELKIKFCGFQKQQKLISVNSKKIVKTLLYLILFTK
jgi:hypothetical protein